MDTRVNPILLRIFLLTLGAALIILAAGFVLDRVTSLQAEVKRYEGLLIALAGEAGDPVVLEGYKAELEQWIGEERGRFIAPEETTVYAFGRSIREELGRRGIAIQGYQVLGERGPSTVEFSVSAPLGSLLSFLRWAGSGEKYVDLPYLVLEPRSQDSLDSYRMIFRIGYVKAPETSR